MKKLTVTLLIATVLNVANVFAQDCDYSGTTGPLQWCLKDGTLTISGTGAMPDYEYPNHAPWYEYRESIVAVVMENGVTTIGIYAFRDCTSLTAVTILNSVTTIGDFAFSTCTSLTAVTIPNSVTTIGYAAFRSCTSLTAIDVASGNNSYASETGILFDKNKTTLICYPAGKTTTSYMIPNSVTTIGSFAFGYCTSLTSITIPNSVTMIGSYAFFYCTSLTSITIPNSVTMIGNYAFYSCTSLTSITIPNSVTTIGNYAFSTCTSLTSVTIPNSVTTIGERAFSFCSSLATVTIPNSVTTIGSYAFGYCTSLTSITNLNPVPVEINSSVFNEVNQSECTLEVPKGSVSAYQNAEVWKEFKIIGIEVGIETITNDESQITVYPNPTSGVLLVKTQLLRQAQQPIASLQDVEIFDMMGRMVYTAKTRFIASLQDDTTILDISCLPSGIYFVRIAGKTVRFVKE